MRTQLQLSAIVLVVGFGSPQLPAGGGEGAKAADVMAQARKALGGESKLSALKALSIRADFRRELGAAGQGGATTVVMMGGGAAFGGESPQMAGTIEIDLVFPHSLYREETITSGPAMTRIEGFEGDRPFVDLVSNAPGIRVAADRPTDDPGRARAVLRRAHAELARLLLGLLAGTQPAMPVRYAYAGQAESPDGTAHVIDVTGPDEFKARLFIDSATHRPLMLTYSELEARPVRMMTAHGGGQPGAATRTVPPPGRSASTSTRAADLSPEQRAEVDRQMKELDETPRKTIEYRLFFSDYREVDGLVLPRRIVRGTADKTTEEWDIKSYTVNPNIKADRFKVGTD